MELKTMSEKQQAIIINLFIYNEIYGGNNNSKPVSKMMRQLRISMNKIPEVEYQKYRDIIHNARNKAIDENTIKGISFIASKEDILQTFWDSLNGNKYQTMWITNKTVVSAINSLEAKQKDPKEGKDLEHTNNSRKIINAMINNVGIKRSNRLSRLKTIIRQNMIIEKG